MHAKAALRAGNIVFETSRGRCNARFALPMRQLTFA